MAEGLDLERRDMQYAVTCDLCDNTAEHLCTTCYDKLCTKCKAVHSKSRSSYDHEVIELNSESLLQLAAQPLVCRTHPGCRADVCCRNCKIPVCEKCLVGDHSDHKTVPTKELFLEKRKKLDEKYSFVQSEFPKYQAQMEKLKISEKKIEKSREIIENEIIAHIKEARQNLDFEESRLLLMSKTQHQLEHIRLQTQKTRVSECLDKIQSFSRMYEKEVSSETYAFILYANVYTESTIPEIFPCFPSPFTLRFSKGTLSEKMFVPQNRIDVHLMPEMLEIEKFQVGLSSVESLAYQLNDNTFWVYISSESRYKKCTRCEDVLFELEADITTTLNKPICAIPNGNVIFRKTGTCLNQLNEDKFETDFLNLNNDIPVCIYFSMENAEIVVAKFNSDTTEGKILKLNNRGESLKDINNKRLLRDTTGAIRKGPWKIVENINGDIILSCEDVTVVDKTGKFRFTYTGCGNTKFPFCSRGICTDITGNILIADKENRFIHVLDINGSLQKLYHVSSENDNFDPITLVIDANHCLCVGCSDGKIRVFKYTV